VGSSAKTPVDYVPFSLEGKSSSTLKFKPGAYALGVEACEFTGVMQVKVTGPVELHISRKKSTASPQHGYELITLIVHETRPNARAPQCYARQGGDPQGGAQGPAGSDHIPQCDESPRTCTADGFVPCYGKSCCTQGPGHMSGGQEVCGP
jgi:hypothetical protein